MDVPAGMTNAISADNMVTGAIVRVPCFLSPCNSLIISLDCPEGGSNISKKPYSSQSKSTPKRGRGGKSGGSRGKKKSAFDAADEW